ncbi:MAG: TraR/DksA family transcriptional regulator [Candidatus Aminicenantales bacterium]
MTKKEKERFQKKLLKRKQEIVDALSGIYTESKEVEDPAIAKDMGDRAETSYTKEFLLSLSDTERKQLQLIDEALNRVKECTYGICQMCGVAIGKKRLEAVPWTPYCIRCQEKAEEETF